VLATYSGLIVEEQSGSFENGGHIFMDDH